MPSSVGSWRTSRTSCSPSAGLFRYVVRLAHTPFCWHDSILVPRSGASNDPARFSLLLSPSHSCGASFHARP